MKFGRRDDRRRQGVVLSMSSMIDCTFLLLAFFLFTTAATRPEDRLTPNLAIDRDRERGSGSDFQPQVVEVFRSEDGPRFRLGTRLFADKPSLAAALRELPRDPGLFVRVEGSVNVAFAAAAVQAARDAGFDTVTYVPASP
ncbi:MAG TPA: biopolymer transporter ExbD [Phycisphaerales bacterium]|nr:biopolymer transporter ExbD [Phycisphaerales bacterium]HMP37131.1 biopolymer transporter ExbD [Phycisphaerales bacterium]